MENFFNWMTKPMPQEEVIIWFNIHNMNYEKIELCGDIFKSFNYIITDTYLGNNTETFETKIILSQQDNEDHFQWCWNKMVEDFGKEDIKIKHGGDHKEYFFNFYNDTFYNQKEKSVIGSIPSFLLEVFDIEKPFTKSDLDILTELYKLIEKNIE
jgi:hypothetical protein